MVISDEYTKTMLYSNELDILLSDLPELSVQINKKNLLKDITSLARKLVNADFVYLRVVDWVDKKLELEEYSGEIGIEISNEQFKSIEINDDSFSGSVFSNQKSIIKKHAEIKGEVNRNNDKELGKLSGVKSVLCVPLFLKKHLFKWDNIPGEDDDKLINYLENKYEVEWVKKAEIKKIEDGNCIKVVGGTNQITIYFNDEINNVILKINDDTINDGLFTLIENDRRKICFEKKPIGVLTALRQIKSTLDFSKEDQINLELFVNQASVALRNAWLFEAQNLQLLGDQPIIYDVVPEAIKRTGADNGRVRFINWNDKYLVSGTPKSNASDIISDLRVSIREKGICPAGMVANNKKSILVNDLKNNEHFIKFIEEIGYKIEIYKKELHILINIKQCIENYEIKKIDDIFLDTRNKIAESLNEDKSQYINKELVKWLEITEKIKDSVNLFSWENILDNDAEKLKEHLTWKYNIDWVKKAVVTRNNDNKIIISHLKNCIYIILNQKNNTVTLKYSDDNIIDSWIVVKNHHLDIYNLAIFTDSINRQIEIIESLKTAWNKYLEYIGSYKSELAVPICVGKDILGVLNVHSDKKNWFIESDQAILEALSVRVATSILLYKQSILNKLGEIEQSMIAVGNFEGMVSAIAKGIKDVAVLADSTDRANIFPLLYICKTPESPNKLIDDQIHFNEKFYPLPRESASIEESVLLRVPIRKKGLGFKAIEKLVENSDEDHKSVLIVRENVDDPISGGSESAQNIGVKTTACLPLVFDGVVYGLLYIHIKMVHFFTILERDALTLFAAYTAIVLKNLTAYGEEKRYNQLYSKDLILDCIKVNRENLK